MWALVIFVIWIVLHSSFAHSWTIDPPLATANPPLIADGNKLPATNLTLQYVAIGRGTQNYTCNAANSEPAQLGAVATLFDATPLAFCDIPFLNFIPPTIVYLPLSSLVDPIILGSHYFGSDGTPVFNLSSVDRILYGMKTADIAAPTTANRGPGGTGAVDWLQLLSKPKDKSVGLSLVYRVVTAGGAAPRSCAAEGVVVVQYAAEYWFYA